MPLPKRRIAKPKATDRKKPLKKRFSTTKTKTRRTTQSRPSTHPQQAKIALVAGVCLIFFSLGLTFHKERILSFGPVPRPVVRTAAHTRPSRITIQALHLDLEVEETSIVGGVWEVSEGGASHLGISASPGEEGPIIIYAHNSADRFGALHRVPYGMVISIATQSGNVHLYKVFSKDIVSNQETDVLSSSDEVLILYTCTGFMDSKRLIVKARRLI